MGALNPAFAGLLPHPPIVVPEVGQARLAECQATCAACREFAARLVAARPDRLLLVSPHAPRRTTTFGIYGGERLRGDLGRFGARAAAVDLKNDAEAAQGIEQAARRAGLEVWSIPQQPLDHGAVVPLRFLVEAGFAGPACVVSPPAVQDLPALSAFGGAIAEAYGALGGRPALVASGDMSHRVTPAAPSGYDPRGLEFDQALVGLAAAGELECIPRIDAALREAAGEDTTESITIVSAALGFHPSGAAVLSYEHPFGVGYLVAILHDGKRAAAGSPSLALLPAIAREAVQARLEQREPVLPEAEGRLREKAPVFVTIRRKDGSLRGCMGSLHALHADLVAETADRALTAAFHDPRFPPVGKEEMRGLRIEVSVLGPCQRVSSLQELDPERFGVVVSDESQRRGVLLPAIEGVDSASAQIAIARRKAGIPEGDDVRVERFQVEKTGEPEEGAA
ncbi:MAG: AmmeMemoRadiSam system protein A [Planctomycetes bacterium]|nr:AmmeMemoRadiSam system protein A [Planctomycetota bacterium]